MPPYSLTVSILLSRITNVLLIVLLVREMGHARHSADRQLAARDKLLRELCTETLFIVFGHEDSVIE